MEESSKPIPVKPHDPTVIIVLTFIIFVLAGCTVLLLYQNIQLKRELTDLNEQQRNAPEPTPTPDLKRMPGTMNIDADTGWWTYSNTQTGVSMKYPTTWLLHEISNPSDSELFTITSPETQQIENANSKLQTQEGYMFVLPDITVSVFSPDVQPVSDFSGAGAPIAIGGKTFKAMVVQSNPPYVAYVTTGTGPMYVIGFTNIQSPAAVNEMEKQIVATLSFTSEPVK